MPTMRRSCNLDSPVTCKGQRRGEVIFARSAADGITPGTCYQRFGPIQWFNLNPNMENALHPLLCVSFNNATQFPISTVQPLRFKNK